MASQEYHEILKQGVEVWNQWRKEHRDVRPDLSGEDLADADLNDARFSFSRLNRVRFSDAQLHRAYFVHSDLSNANCSRLSTACPVREEKMPTSCRNYVVVQ